MTRIIRELGPGDKGQQVERLQRALEPWFAECGYLDQADGIYGRKTSAAVAAFRASVGLGEGNATKDTLRALGLWSNTLPGIDVSHHNGRIDWGRVASSGVTWAYIKATEGADFVDHQFEENALGAINAGLRVGAYHFARGVKGEAEHFSEVTDGCGLTLPPALDIEGPFSLAGSDGAAWIRDWLEAFDDGRAIVYSSARVWREKALGAAQGAMLWAPRYSDHTTAGPQPKTEPWQDWHIWQYTDGASVPGVPTRCDRDVMVTP